MTLIHHLVWVFVALSASPYHTEPWLNMLGMCQVMDSSAGGAPSVVFDRALQSTGSFRDL